MTYENKNAKLWLLSEDLETLSSFYEMSETEIEAAKACASESLWKNYPLQDSEKVAYLIRVLEMYVCNAAKAAEQQKEPGRENFAPLADVYRHRVDGVINRLQKLDADYQIEFVEALAPTAREKINDWAGEAEQVYFHAMEFASSDSKSEENIALQALWNNYVYANASQAVELLIKILNTHILSQAQVAENFANEKLRPCIMIKYEDRVKKFVRGLEALSNQGRRQFIGLIDESLFKKLIEWCDDDDAMFVCAIISRMEEKWTQSLYVESDRRRLPFPGEFNPFEPQAMREYNIFRRGAEVSRFRHLVLPSAKADELENDIR